MMAHTNSEPDELVASTMQPNQDFSKEKSVPGSETLIALRAPKQNGDQASVFQPPALEWLEGTWSVTHSTLPMWRKAKNVRITYKIIPPSSSSQPTRLDDEVTSEPTQRTLMPQPKSIKGIDTPAGPGAWDWRGRGWLRIASSHWEVLGWGERDGERWVVTWFAPSMFTPAGLDVYSSRKEGISDKLYEDISQALQRIEADGIGVLCKKDMQAVKIEY